VVARLADQGPGTGHGRHDGVTEGAAPSPSDANPLRAAIRGLNRLAGKHAMRLRQSYLLIAKYAAMMTKRYGPTPSSSNRNHRQLCRLRTRSVIIRDIHRKIGSGPRQVDAFARQPDPRPAAARLKGLERRARIYEEAHLSRAKRRSAWIGFACLS
jgi:hypothetical protein